MDSEKDDSFDISSTDRPDMNELMEISKSGRLLKRLIGGKFRPTENQIDAYNHWTTVDLIRQIENTPVYFGQKDILLRFGPTFINSPTITIRDRTIPLTPALANLMGVDYMSEVSTVLTLIEGGDINDPCKGKVYDQSEFPVVIGAIPTMVMSKLCHLWNKSPEKIAELGSDYREVGGYFIVGNERLMYFIEKVRVNRVIAGVTPKKGYPYVNMTAMKDKGSMVTTMTAIPRKTPDGIDTIISLTLNNVKEATKTGKIESRMYNILKIIRLYALYKAKDFTNPHDFYTNPFNLQNIIMSFIQPERQSRCKTELAQTIQDAFFGMDKDDEEFIGMVKKNQDRYVKKQKKKNANFDTTSFSIHESTLHAIESSLLSHEDHTKPEFVIYTACMMVANCCEVMAGYREYTNRNKWMYKRVDTAAIVCAQLFRGFWRSLTTKLHSSSKKFIKPTVAGLKGKISSNVITNDFRTSFVTAWGLGAINDNKENLTQILQQETFYEKLSNLAHTTAKVDEKVKNYDVRSHHPDQWGYMDIGYTTENARVGLSRNMAITAYVTIPESSEEIKDIIYGIIGTNNIGSTNYISMTPVGDYVYVVLVNGKFIGWADGKVLLHTLIAAKRENLIPRTTSIYNDTKHKYLIVSTDPGRLTRPLLIVENNVPVIERKNLWDAPIETLYEKECLEYIDTAEINKIRIAPKEEFLDKWQGDKDHYTSRVEELSALIEENDDLQEKRDLEKQLRSAKEELVIIVTNPYTHMEVNPQAYFGPTLANMPFIGFEQAPRVTYQSQQGKQALGMQHSEYAQRFDNNTKILRRPVRPLVGHQLENEMFLDKYQQGLQLMIMFLNKDGQTMEDAFIMLDRLAEFGIADIGHYFVVSADIGRNERLIKPPPRYGETEDSYKFLTNDGLPMINAPVNPGDFVLGKEYVDPKTRERRNTSTQIKLGEYGFVDTVMVVSSGGTTTVKIRIRRHRELEIGDKFASRYAQKGTASEKYPFHKMPFDLITGERPAMIVNTHSTPRRMTLGYMLEPILSNMAAITGKRINASPFEKPDVDSAYRLLSSYGFDATGYRWVRDPRSGMKYRAMVYTGSIQIQVLRHLGPEKFQSRCRGPVKLLTRQPPRNGKAGNSARQGTMETNALLSHGAIAFLNERMMDMSDAYTTAFCRRCSDVAVVHADTGIAKCTYCEKEGRESDIVRVRIPYVYKLMVQLLAGCHINMRFDFKSMVKGSKQPKIPDDAREGEEGEDVDDDSDQFFAFPEDDIGEDTPGDDILEGEHEMYADPDEFGDFDTDGF
jgi:DNA-directed RNA polymerase beta subunit